MPIARPTVVRADGLRMDSFAGSSGGSASTIDLAHLSFDEARHRVGELTARIDEVNKTADVPFRLAHYMGRRNVAKGRQTYEVDLPAK
jgi:hypothetical protein